MLNNYRSGTGRVDRVQYLAIFLISMLALAPFMNKGVTYDDIIFLDYAQRLTKNPFSCQVSDYMFQGMLLKNFIVFESTHPPFIPYWLKTLAFIFGDSLRAYHIGFWPFTIIAGLSLGFLVRRWCDRSPIWALALTLGPLFLPNATSLMSDVPLFAFWAAAMACWEIGISDDTAKPRPWQLLTAVLLCAACFTAYQGLGLLVILWLRGMATRKIPQTVLVTVLALLPFIVWLIVIWWRYDLFPFFITPREELSIAGEIAKGTAAENMWLKTLVGFLYLGAGLSFFNVLGLGIVKRGGRWFALLAHLGWGWILCDYLFHGSVPTNMWLGWVMAAGGAAVVPLLFTACKQGMVSREDRTVDWVLVIWFLGFIGFQIVIAAFAAPRYILGAPAALLLILLRHLPRQQWAAAALVPAMLGTIGFGFLVASAEYEYAAIQDISDLELPEQIHVLGEKGMKYSAVKNGHIYYHPELEHQLRYLLVPREIDHIRPPVQLLETAEVVKIWDREGQVPLRVMNREVGAGFYIHTRGLMPFAFGKGPLDTFTLYKVYQQAAPAWPSSEPDIKPIGEILPDRPVRFSFTSAHNGLESIALNFATYARTNTSHLTISLRQQGSQQAVVEKTISASELEDNQWYDLHFPSVDTSAGETFILDITSEDAAPNNAVTLWIDGGGQGDIQYGEQTVKGIPGLRARCFLPTPSLPESAP